MVHDDDRLDEILRSRRVPEMRSNLEHRIVQASLQQDKQKGKAQGGGILDGILSSIFDNLLVPQPVLAMAFLLVFGVAIGGYPLESSLYDTGSDMDADTMAFFLEADDFDYGEIL